jgi:hypothetical protein
MMHMVWWKARDWCRHGLKFSYASPGVGVNNLLDFKYGVGVNCMFVVQLIVVYRFTVNISLYRLTA